MPEPAAPVPAGPQAPWPQELQARSLYWHRAQVLYRVQLKTPRGKASLRALITAELPDLLRIEAFSIWGRSHGLYIQDGTVAKVWIPAPNQVYVSHDSMDMMQRLIGIPIPAGTLLHLLLACAPPGAVILPAQESGARENTQPAALDTAGSRPHSVWQLATDHERLTGIHVQIGPHRYTVRYQPGLPPTGGKLPKRAVLTHQDWQLQVETLQVARPQQIDPGLFRMQPPATAETHFIP